MPLEDLLTDPASTETAAPAVVTGEQPASPRRRRRSARRAWSRRRRLLAGLAVLVVAAAAVVTWAATRSSAAAAPTTRLVTATTRTLRSTVAATGTIQPAQTANLSFAVSGQVTSVPATVGEAVTAGQPLATINATSLSTSVAQANATVANDAAKLTSDTNAAATAPQLAADQAALSSAQAAYTVAQSQLSSATLTAPVAGKVAAVNLTVGQQVSGGGTTGTGSSGAGSGSSGSGSGGSGGAGGGSTGGSTGAGSATGSGGSASSSGSGGSASGSSAASSSTSSAASSSGASSSAQVVVISNGSHQVAGTVDDTEVGQVKTGEQAVITPDGSTTPVYGTVATVGLVPSSTSGVAAYPVTVNVTGNPGGLYPGAGASLSIVVRQLTGVLAVPTAALHSSAAGSYVDLTAGGKQARRTVTTGLASNGYTQITGGLADGAQIVAPAGVRTRTGTGTGGRTGFGGGTGGFGGGTGGFGGTGTGGTRGGGG